MRTLKPGDRFHHYHVGRLLGEGFHGQVHEVIHPHTGARFALKTMQLAHVNKAPAVRRALAEARGTYGIDHANVLDVLDFNCEDDGFVWMRTELLDGETIAELLSRLGYLSPLFALSVAIEAAYGLAAAHEAQIIHRDVKPGNLFHVRPTRSIKVIDFSIAKFFAEGLETTAGRAGMGTPAYMCPEQLEGLLPTPAFDIYALGLTLWQMLVGRHPFHDVLNHSRELFHRQFSEMPPLLADVLRLPPEVDRVIRRALAKDAVDRFHTMREMARALVDLRAWLQREASEGRVLLRVAPGEPPIPGDPRVRRDYTPAAPIPRSEQPTPAPGARIVLPALSASVPLGTLGGTLPLDAGRGPGGTLPLTSTPLPSRAEIIASSERVEAPSSVSLPSLPSLPATQAPPPSVPQRVPWKRLGAAMILAGLVSAAVVSRLRGRTSHDIAPATNTSPPPEPTATQVLTATPTSSAVESSPPTPTSSQQPVPPPRPHGAPAKPARRPPAVPLEPQTPSQPSPPPRAASRTFDVDN